MLRFLTAGESHGEGLIGILDGFPKGVRVSKEFIDSELSRRQKGLGRGPRMQIEKDEVKIISGLRAGVSLGSPISFMVENKDKKIDVFKKDNLKSVTIPRPAHGDLAGALKYLDPDINNILERASARETAVRVVAGAICKECLSLFNIKIGSFVRGLGRFRSELILTDVDKILKLTQDSPAGCIDRVLEKKIVRQIKKAIKNKDTLGGIIEVVATGVPPGLGSFMQWDKRLDARIAYALISIPGVKAIETGAGFKYAVSPGSSSHDAIFYSKKKGFYHKSNNSGGIEAGISNGEPIVVRIGMKPIASLGRPLSSVDFVTKKPSPAPAIRSDVTAVSSCGVVAESMLAYVLLSAFLEKFSSDSLSEIKKNYRNYLKALASF